MEQDLCVLLVNSRMPAITWTPGTDNELDQMFNLLREEQYNDRTHHLWPNYSKESFDSAVALTIYFDETDKPVLCSSVSSRDCWPTGAYRILNRTWKPYERLGWPKGVGSNFGETIQSQIDWLEITTECKLYFVSRQKQGWQDWCIRSFKKHGHIFKKNNQQYLTCPNECDDTCWQLIIYNGDEDILTQWKHR